MKNEQIYEFGPFRLEVGERRLLRDGEPVSLRPKVFDTLRTLVENHGTLVTKDELMRAVWPDSIVEEGIDVGDETKDHTQRDANTRDNECRRNVENPACFATIPDSIHMVVLTGDEKGAERRLVPSNAFRVCGDGYSDRNCRVLRWADNRHRDRLWNRARYLARAAPRRAWR